MMIAIKYYSITVMAKDLSEELLKQLQQQNNEQTDEKGENDEL